MICVENGAPCFGRLCNRCGRFGLPGWVVAALCLSAGLLCAWLVLGCQSAPKPNPNPQPAIEQFPLERVYDPVTDRIAEPQQ